MLKACAMPWQALSAGEPGMTIAHVTRRLPLVPATNRSAIGRPLDNPPQLTAARRLRSSKPARGRFARFANRSLATVLALVTLAAAHPALAQNAGGFVGQNFVGGKRIVEVYTCHNTGAGNACENGDPKTIIYNQVGSFTDASSWCGIDPFGVCRAPGPNDGAAIDGHHSGYFEPKMGPGGPVRDGAVLRGYYTIGFNGTAGFEGDGFHVSNVSGTVQSLSLTGFGTAEIGAITATDSTFLRTSGGFSVAKFNDAGEISYFGNGFESQGLTITGGGTLHTHLLEIAPSTFTGFVGPIDIKGGTTLHGDIVRILSAAPARGQVVDPPAVSAPVTISALASIEAGATLSLLLGDTATTTVILDSGFLDATGQTGRGDLIIGTTADGTPANFGQRFIVKADGASRIASAKDTLIGLYGAATLEARGSTKVDTGGDGFIGVLDPAAGSSVLLSGAGVEWKVAQRLLIGGNTSGNLTAENGATLTVNDRLFLGVNAGSRGNVSITSGATVTADGKAGAGTIAVSIGDGAGSFGDLEVKGQGSKLTSMRVLAVGFNGMGGLSVSEGGVVEVQDTLIRVGRNAGSDGTVKVAGTGSQLTGDAATLYAGFFGKGDVSITNHALLRVMATEIGSMTGAVGTLKLDGASDESSLGKVIVGGLGTGTLTVAHGKVVAEAVQVGAMADSHGTLTLQDNAELDAATVAIGVGGAGTATIESGAKLMIKDPAGGAESVIVGNRKDSTGTLTIKGANSLVQGHFGLIIGEAGKGTVNISDGGRLDIGDKNIVIGSQAGSEGTLTVDSSNGGSSIALDKLVVGLAGKGTLDLKGGGLFDVRTIGPSANAVIIGQDVGSEGTLKLSNLTLDLTGGGRNRITIGDKGNGTLELRGGAHVIVDNSTVGLGATGEHHLIIAGQGAEYRVLDTIRVGSGTGATGSVALSDGGKLFADKLNIGGPESTTFQALVSVAKGAEISGASRGATDILVQGNGGVAQLEARDQAVIHFGSIQVMGSRSTFFVSGDSTLIRTDTSKVYGVDIGDSGAFDIRGSSKIDLGPVRVSGGGTFSISGQTGGDQPTVKLGNVLLESGSDKNDLFVLGGAHVSFTKLDLQAGTATFGDGSDVTIDDLQSSQTGSLPTLNISEGARVHMGKSGGSGEFFANLNTKIRSDASLEINGTTFVIPGGDARVRVLDGGSLTVSTATFEVDGTLAIGNGGTLLRVGGSISLGPNGTLSAGGNSSSLRGISAITAKSGSMIQAANNASFEVSNSINLGTGSTIDAASGTIRIGSGAFIAPIDPKTNKPFTDGVLNDPGYIVVKSGGLLSGSGIVFGNVVNGGGTVHVGNSPGKITVTGDYLQGPGGALLLSVGSTDYSKLIVGGSAIFSGGKIVIDVAPGTILTAGTQYQFITAAGGVTGQVAQIEAPTAFAGFQTSFAGGVLSAAVVHRAGSYAAAATTTNQRGVAQAFDTLVPGTANAVVTSVSNLLLNQTAAALPGVLDQLSGEVHASAIAALVEDSTFGRDAMLERADETSGSGAWARAATVDGRIDADGNAAAVRRSGEQYLMGADKASDHWRAGIAGIYGHLRHDLAARASSEKTNSYAIGTYAGLRQGPVSLTAAVSYSWNDIATRRSVTALGLNEGEAAGYTAHAFRATGQIAFKLPVGSASISPFARLDYVRADAGTINERGGAAAITGTARISTAFTGLGLRGTALVQSSTGPAIQLRGSANWQHDLDTTHAIALLGLPGAPSASVDSVELPSDALVVSASADVQLGRATLGVGYNGSISSTAHDNRVSARLSLAF